MLGLGRPDAFRGDPYGWLTNQMSHVLCGVIGAWLLVALGAPGWGAVVGAALASAAVETLHLRRDGTIRDSVSDLGFIAGGAVWQVSGGSFGILLLLVSALALGVQLRAREPRASTLGDS